MIKWLTVLDVGLACELITQPRVLLRRTEAFVIILMISKPTAVSIVVALTTCSLHRRFSLGTGARVGRINWHGNERGRNPLCKDDDGGRRSDRHEVNLHKARHTVGVSRGTMRSPATTTSRRGPSTAADGVTGGRNLPPPPPFSYPPPPSSASEAAARATCACRPCACRACRRLAVGRPWPALGVPSATSFSRLWPRLWPGPQPQRARPRTEPWPAAITTSATTSARL